MCNDQKRSDPNGLPWQPEWGFEWERRGWPQTEEQDSCWENYNSQLNMLKDEIKSLKKPETNKKHKNNDPKSQHDLDLLQHPIMDLDDDYIAGGCYFDRVSWKMKSPIQVNISRNDPRFEWK